jgi:hypothetical protein
LIRSLNELSLPNSVIVCHIADAILFQEMIDLPRILVLEELRINSVAVTRVVTG